jgi:hypothetical protein
VDTHTPRCVELSSDGAGVPMSVEGRVTPSHPTAYFQSFSLETMAEDVATAARDVKTARMLKLRMLIARK